MLTNIQKINRLKLIERAYHDNCMHIPSALSMLDYFYFLNKKINYINDALVIGKPYGQLAYHTIWNSDNNLPVTGKTQNITWADTTLGNCLGVACGLAISNSYNKVFVNIGDGSLQEGTVLEAAQFIGSYNKFKSKIILCIDCNKYQCISKNYQSVNDIKNIFLAFKWNVIIVNGHNDDECKKINIKNNTIPLCIIFDTIKGYGIDIMQNNPIEWHYKKLSYNDYIYFKKYLNEL